VHAADILLIANILFVSLLFVALGPYVSMQLVVGLGQLPAMDNG
jgi:hypothetical protein